MNGVVYLLPTDLGNRRSYQCNEGMVSEDQALQLYVELQVSYLSPFICSLKCRVIVKRNAVH